MKQMVIVLSAAILVMACASAPSTGSAIPEPAAAAGEVSPPVEILPPVEVSPPAEQTLPDVPAAANQVPIIVNRVPSFKTKESVYFTAGVLDEYLVFAWEGAHLMSETRYSASDTMLERSEYRYSGSQPILKTTRIVEDGREQVRSQVMYEYTRNRLQKETLKNGGGIVISSNEYAYNAEGNCTSRIMKNANGIIMAQTEYTYTRGKLTSSETKSVRGDRINLTEYRYDAQGNCIRQETRNGGGNITSVLNATWQNGLETREELTGPDNTLQLRETNQYNANGDVIKKTIENLQGNSVQIVEYEYKLAGQ